MKLRLLHFLTLGLLSFSLFAQNPASEPEELLYIPIGKTLQLYDKTVETGTARWFSADTAIVTVASSGLAIGKSEGITSVYVQNKMGEITNKQSVKVYFESKDSSISDQPDSLTIKPELPIDEYYLYVGESLNITPPTVIALPYYEWKSSNSNVASVDNIGTVTGNSKGKATIYFSANDSKVISEYSFIILDSSINSIMPKIPTFLKKMALGDTMIMKSTNGNSVFVSSDSSFISNNYGKFIPKQLGDYIINEFDLFGDKISIWNISVYDGQISNPPVDTGFVIQPNPAIQKLYMQISNTLNIVKSLNLPQESKIEWVDNGVIKQINDSIYKAVAVGYTKCTISFSVRDVTYKVNAEIFVFENNYNKNIDSIIEIMSAPIIDHSNFVYQNYKKLELIDSNTLRIIFDKPINDISLISNYLTLNIETTDVYCNLCKSNSSLTVKKVMVDPTNSNAIFLITEEVIPADASIAVIYNNVSLISEQGNAFNKAISANNNLNGFCETIGKRVTLSPNVSSNFIHINVPDFEFIQIITPTGNVLRQINNNIGNDISIDISDLRPGTYFAKIKISKTQIISKRFIKL